MLSGRTIFILGLMRFDDPIESTNYTIAKALARDNQVFYFDNPYTWKDCLRLRGTPAYARRKPQFPASASGIIDTLVTGLKVVIVPPVPSINWLPEGRIYRAALRIPEQQIARRMEQVKAQFRLRDIIFINSFNMYYPGVGRLLKPALQVYHCVDPLIHAFELKHGRDSQDEIAIESDLVICTSKQLVRDMLLRNTETYLVPNAADVSHAGKALDPALPEHPALHCIRRPRVGYFGAIERRFDFALVAELAARHRDWTFVLAGPVSKEYVPAGFRDIPNIFLTGAVPYDELPSMLKGFDAGIIPFKKDSVSASIFPLKLFEYLAAGLPVVSTGFNPDLVDFTGPAVSYCASASAFSDALADAIHHDTRESRASRIELAARNTWKHRAEEFGAIISAHLKPEPSPSRPFSSPSYESPE
jgi:teichuronic acid biosynthesis glycosyltransferase TuaH